ncbi:neuropeptide FF receptor 2 [Passer montanus]|uniref:neuropeptide FF receptor 2 n=1 Tax=Passer montanus TaxID=9160 RepID=UPI0019609ED4|nr:neuropeptide FF receptor 2 [Passer montanus]XP_039566235.1 neuropeptide FF receptor 2 [Passer montanus]XP_039566236.1 neuropeptide FF receptor 2 [Passer montanus]XP_039566237.1 neuropeptide FF receptor 2 [Passer montanus]XP_039566238.1 neuropeptide FF receptor 2 [Passer montanus]XP_039566239.1 neuropeptide FF receptor 2 [Passer montanus]XP_039566240.1 neuropeptide FF receptor 2 [Passer montanus]XP_039566241.1 neuropeptide FF receptor 2 [Passer montanus]XP_039566242.1 neuropeptide FF rece
MDSNSSWGWPHLDLLDYNGTYEYLYLEGNVSYVGFYLHQPWVAAVFITSYLLIFLLCLVGNGGVCFIILWSRHMRTVTNLFILNLAVSDLLVGLFCMPTTLLDNIIAGWPFGSLVCKMSGMVQGISVSASVFTLVAIAVDRFRCIVHPFKQKLSVPAAVATIAAIWLLAVAIMCPSAVLLRVREEKRFRVLLGAGSATRPLCWCREEWPEPAMRRIYTAVLFANVYLAPLSLIALMYARIGLSLSRAAGPGKRGRERRRGAWKRKRKATQMLVLVTLLFALSWLPLWTLMLLSDYASLSDVQLQLIHTYLYPLAHWLAFSNSSTNPLIYGLCKRSFRRGFRAALGLRLRSRPACSRPCPRNAVPPAAQTAQRGKRVNSQRDLLAQELGGGGTE